MATEEITVYVDMEMEDGWGAIKLYSDANGEHEISGDLSIGKDGGVITFARLPNRNVFWSFWNLTVHPLGNNTDVVNLDWKVTNDGAVLTDTRAARRARQFSYTLALEHEDGTKFYLDPKLVNTGG